MAFSSVSLRSTNSLPKTTGQTSAVHRRPFSNGPAPAPPLPSRFPAGPRRLMLLDGDLDGDLEREFDRAPPMLTLERLRPPRPAGDRPAPRVGWFDGASSAFFFFFFLLPILGAERPDSLRLPPCLAIASVLELLVAKFGLSTARCRREGDAGNRSMEPSGHRRAHAVAAVGRFVAATNDRIHFLRAPQGGFAVLDLFHLAHELVGHAHCNRVHRGLRRDGRLRQSRLARPRAAWATL